MEHPENDDLYRGLKVNKGVADVPTVNPYLKKKLRREYTPSEFVEGILKGNITILSQAVTLVESAKYEHQQIAQEIIEKCLPHAGKSVRIGITGVPGAGKSTSIDAFGMHLIKEGRKLAVLAVTKPVWKPCHVRKMRLSALPPRQDHWEVLPAKHAKRSFCAKLPASILYSLKR